MKKVTDLTSREIASIKRIFLNNLPMYKKIESISTKIEELNKEKEDLNTFIESSENGVKNLTGYTSGQLIKCDYIPQYNEDGTPKMDKENKYQLKKRTLTFVVPVEDNTENTTETPVEEKNNEVEGNNSDTFDVFPDSLNEVNE